jgi:hypothetical protein
LNVPDALKALIPLPVKYALDCIECTELEIIQAGLIKTQASLAFKACLPSDLLRDKSVDLFRVHARELCQRVKFNHKLEPATNAELLALFSNTSLRAPLTQTGQACMEKLFKLCFPKSELEGAEYAAREPWPGAVDEEIETCRRKFRQERA